MKLSRTKVALSAAPLFSFINENNGVADKARTKGLLIGEQKNMRAARVCLSGNMLDESDDVG